jgi:hypothetical protein
MSASLIPPVSTSAYSYYYDFRCSGAREHKNGWQSPSTQQISSLNLPTLKDKVLIIADQVLDGLKEERELELAIANNSPENAKLIKWLRQGDKLKSIKIHFVSDKNLYDEFYVDLQDMTIMRASEDLPIMVWVGNTKVLDSTEK